MRRNTKFLFTKKDSRPVLTCAEARYWESILKKVCKVGFEFEYNLAESRGTCAGNTYICPCSHPKKETTKCYAQCASYDNCKLRLKHDCPGINCIVFKSPCTTCLDAVRDCSRCDLYNDPNKKPMLARKHIEKALAPSNDLSKPGKYGAFEVIKDGSLLGDGGIEVTTVGRRVSFDSFYEQGKKIVEECLKYGAYVNERTSLHMHLVAGYFNLSSSNGIAKVVYSKKGTAQSSSSIDELEKEMPEIVLANFHQLLRRYHNALTWITSSGDNEDNLTRWSKFRKPIINYSALRNSMPSVVREIVGGDEQRGKYMFMNYTSLKFNDNGNVRRFHVEGRFSDGILAPSAIASLGILLYALLIKAVSLSQHGIMHSGSKEYMDNAYEIRKVLLNNEGNWNGPRCSDTSKFAPYKETVRKEAEEMLAVLHSELRHHGKAADILHKMAEKPCSLRLIEGKTWNEIENELSEKEDVDSPAHVKILEAIDTFYVDDCVDESEWSSTIAQDLEVDHPTVQSVLGKLIKRRQVMWDSVVGTYVRC